MEIDELPIGERLDALLRQFDDETHNPEGDLDYAQFVERRAHEHDFNRESDVEPDHTAAAESDVPFDSDTENHWFSGNELDEAPLLSPLSSPRDSQSPVKGVKARTKPKKLKKKSKALSERSSHTENPVEPIAIRPVDKHVADVYSEAGIEMPSSSGGGLRAERAPRRTAKQTQREIEEAARQNQRLERMLVDEIGCHTAKTVTVDDFLAEFDARPNSPPSSPARPKQADKRFSELVSSPPRMQGLRSFIAHGDAHRKEGTQSPSAMQSDPADSDSDLEIIPETRAARMSQPIRELLRFGGGTTADRQLAASRAKLQQMERDQIINRSRSRVEKLKAQGFDVDGLTSAMNQQRQASAQGAAAWLARERAEADALLAAERSDEGEPVSDVESEASSSDLEIGGDDDADGHGAGGLVTARQSRKLVLSDSEDESGPEGNADSIQAPGALPEASGFAPITQTAAEPEVDTDEDEGDQFTGGTQYVAPLSPRARAALFGSQAGTLEPSVSAVSESLPETRANSSPQTLDDQVNQAPDGNEMSDLEIEVGRDADEEDRVEPDLADLRHANLSLSQRMAEVRQRYLRAEHEQRRQVMKNKRRDPGNKPVRSAFVEDQAEESDDEEGAGGIRRRDNTLEGDEEDNDDDDANNVDLAGLVDHDAVDVRAAKLKQKFIAEERAQDERLLNHFVEGVNGGFRRRKTRDADGVFLSDDDIEFDNNEEIRAYRQMLEQKRQSKLLGSSSRVARMAASERNQAFFKSITTELIARPPGAERSSTVQDGLQFLRSVAESTRRQPQISGAADDDGAASTADLADRESAPTGLSTALKLASLRDPKQARRPSRQPTIQDPFKSGLSGRRATYASRVSASEAPSVNTMEIMQSLGPKQTPRPKKSFAPGPAAAPSSKKRRIVSTTAHKSGAALFRRSWT